jgi:replicative DNA helicase
VARNVDRNDGRGSLGPMTQTYENDLPIPSSIDSERTILGAILLDNEAFFDDSVDIQADDFFLDSHRRIYLAMNDILFGLVEDARHVDIVTLANELSKRKWIEAVGGVSYLASLTEGLPLRPAIREYVLILKDKARLRSLMNIFKSGVDRASDQSEPSSGILDSVQEQLLDMSAKGGRQAISLAEIDVEVEIKSKREISDERTALELTWGVKGLDEFTHGAFRGEFTIISGETGGGKTSYILQMLLANASGDIPCGLFSMEMTKEQVKKRCYPLLSEILTSNHLRDPRLMNLHTHVPEMERVTRELAKLPLYIDDTRQLRIDKLIAKMRMLRRKLGIKLFAVDYLQLLEGIPGMSEAASFRKTIFALRDFPTIEPDCALIVLSQYSKADGFTRTKKRTRDSLYGGSVIQHAAQNIFMITIEDPEKRDEKDLLDTEFRIAKQRDGKRGKVTCYYDRDHYKFTYPSPFLKGT